MSSGEICPRRLQPRLRRRAATPFPKTCSTSPGAEELSRTEFPAVLRNLERFRDAGDSPEIAALAATWRLLHEAVDRDGGASLDLPSIATEYQKLQPGTQALIDFIIGMFLDKHGKPLEAREFLLKATANPLLTESLAPLAQDTIRKIDQHEDLSPRRQAQPLSNFPLLEEILRLAAFAISLGELLLDQPLGVASGQLSLANSLVLA